MMFLFNCFEATIFKSCVSYICVFIGGVSIAIALNGLEGFPELLMISIVGFLCIAFILRIIQQVNIEMVENFRSKVDQKNMFETIVKNIEESLVIFEDNRIKLLNP